jgi:GAF domain-containing protein
VTSDFKDVLRERIDGIVRSRLATVEAAVASARGDIESAFGRLQETAAASPVETDDGATLDQLSAEIAARVGQAAAESSRLSGDLALLRDSVVDIDGQQTQADVLNALVERAFSFAPRVVLFVVKGEDAIAWAARGFEDEVGDDAVRGLSVSTRSETLIGSVLAAQTTYLGESVDQKDNSVLLDRLGSTNPERIAGIPLRVRGKTVGILYADSYDTSVGSIGIEALELLVHSAGIIVELASLRQRLAEPTRPAGTGTLQAAALAPPPPSPAPRRL